MAKKKILIVDDNEDIAKGLRILFRSRGYIAAVAGDAVSAISQAKSQNPDMIVLDLGLPAGDGYLVMERLSNIEALALTPVIVCTARKRNFTNNWRSEREQKAFFQKPVDHEALLATVEQILDGPSAMQPSAF
jgi:CheY-like chemotaxis protein